MVSGVAALDRAHNGDDPPCTVPGPWHVAPAATGDAGAGADSPMSAAAGSHYLSGSDGESATASPSQRVPRASAVPSGADPSVWRPAVAADAVAGSIGYCSQEGSAGTVLTVDGASGVAFDVGLLSRVARFHRMHPSVLKLPFSPATPVGRRQYLGQVTYHSWTSPGTGCWQLTTSESPGEGLIAIYDIAGTYLSTRLLFSSALASVLPRIDRGDVPSPLGVLDGVWWREVVPPRR
jgi:hypothetical protein